MLKTEAAKLLLPAKESPFSRVALGRLSNFLNLVFNPEKQRDPKIQALRGLDPTFLIICGLCLTQKALDSMRKELFDVFVEQAMIASRRSVNIIAKSDDINKVVHNSAADHDFNADHLNLRQMTSSSGPLTLQYSLAGSPCWCYSGVPQQRKRQTMFSRLLTKAIPGLVTTFLPLEGFMDGLIRVVVAFDQSLLQTLFGWASHETVGIECFSVGCAVKNQIALLFGDDVFEAVVTSHMWTQDTGEIETKCLKVDVYPALLMVISLTVGWTSCYQFVNSAYIL
ncbi:hypothetical protein DM02DRAFT_545680 [Periconia macrospinosa]|uniref:Uncharacterized protein n=1 Tax=Periconia macrospinosa TaxID=97972 RepID=A0A2V1D0I5_9PLEO|nr:hypothetical protein DM02DRAFT_545680 [Periconia macrospinosa]